MMHCITEQKVNSFNFMNLSYRKQPYILVKHCLNRVHNLITLKKNNKNLKLTILCPMLQRLFPKGSSVMKTGLLSWSTMLLKGFLDFIKDSNCLSQTQLCTILV